MRRVFRRAIATIGLLATVLVGALVSLPAPAEAFTGTDIANIALGQVGNGGCNPGYYNSCNEDWCADFARWVWAQAGVANTDELNAAAVSFYQYGQNHGTLSNTPAVGDAVVFNYVTDGGPSHNHQPWADHVALVVAVNPSTTITVVGGNEGSGNHTQNLVAEDPNGSSAVGSAPWGQTISGYVAPVGLGSSASPPVSLVGHLSNDSYDAFARGTNGTLQQWHWAAGAWGAPTSHGGSMMSSPSAVNISGDGMDVFYQGTNKDLWHSWEVGGTWHGPQDLGMGPLGGPPRAVGQPDGTVDVFWKGTTNALWSAHYDPSAQAWSGPTNFGGAMSSDPSPVLSGTGIIDVFWMGTDKNLWEKRDLGGAWQANWNMGMGPLGGPPMGAGQSDGTLDVFWRGTNNFLYSAHMDGSTGNWSSFINHGGALSSDPYPVTTQLGTVDVFYTGASNNLYHFWAVSGTWYGPQSLGFGPLGSPPAAASPGDGNVMVGWKGTSGPLWTGAYHVSGGWDTSPVSAGGAIG
jgi:hypothetical protein